jgi:integrase
LSVDDEVRKAIEKAYRLVSAETTSAPTFTAMMAIYMQAMKGEKSEVAYRRRLIGPLKHFGPMPVDHVTPVEAVVYRQKRTGGELGKKVCAYTAEIELDLVKWALNWLVDNGHLATNPLARLRRKKVKNEPQAALREEHLEAVLAACPNLTTAVYVVLVIDTGARRTEALTLRWDDVNWKTGVIIIRNGKGGKRREVVCSGRALDLLRQQPRVVGSPFIFANSRIDGGPPFAKETLNEWVRHAIMDSGVEKNYGGRKVRIHGLRRGHATNAVERGVDIRSVQEQLGHESIATTQKYIDSRMDHRLKEMRKNERPLPAMTDRRPAKRAPGHVAPGSQDPCTILFDSNTASPVQE